MSDAPCAVIYAGKLLYAEAWSLQKRLAAARAADAVPDTLLLLEHPHTYTLGSAGKLEHLLLTPAQLAERGIALHHVDRGGDITYHGDGQLVGYPILRLPGGADGLHADVIAYLRTLEQVIIDFLACYGVQGERIDGLSGVWVRRDGAPHKIAALGVRVTSKRITQHGFALNITTDLRYFDGIVPCGIRDKGVTRLADLVAQPPDLLTAAQQLASIFAAHFKRQLHAETLDRLLGTSGGCA
ncbi:MAG: lipoyl(octanoyl) transferase LipB [Chloroflexi bacterium]|nr:lipoyl(octanoyl) transferase LipB [Chloroflexota bacterium]